MRNNRIEHLIDAPYATNDRAFYIYFDEATDVVCFAHGDVIRGELIHYLGQILV